MISALLIRQLRTRQRACDKQEIWANAHETLESL